MRQSGRPAAATGCELSHVDAAQERIQVQVLRSLLWTFVILTAAIMLIGLTTRHYREAVISAVGGAVYGVLLAVLPRWGARRTGVVCTVWYFLLASVAMAVGRGVHDVTMVLFPAGMVVAALLLPRRLLVPLIGLSMVTVAAVGVAKALGLLPHPDSPEPLEDVAVAVLLLLVAGVLTQLVVRSLQAMVAERRKAELATAQSRDELEARNEALKLVNELAHRLHRSLDVGEIAHQAVDVLIRHSQPPLVAVYLLDEGATQLRLVADHGFTEEVRALGATLPLEGSLSGVALRERRLVSSEDLGTDSRVHPGVGAALAASGLSSALSIPLAFHHQSLGTINLIFTQPPRFGTVELDTLRAIGQAISLALSNARHVTGLEHQAFHDALTGLPNRASLHREFADRLAQVASETGRAGLVLLDLNRFREINEALGHSVGDVLLVETASRLSRCLGDREAQLFRLGGDEFAALVPGLDGASDATAQAHRLLAALGEPFAVAGLALEVGATAGIALYPDHGRDSHEVLRCADVALHRAKSTAAAVASYSREYDEHTPERLALAAELGKAVREGKLVLHFQPTVALATGETVGFEALVRWPHPRLGLLGPAEFLPLAEASDVIHPLTYWVVENALVQLARWHGERPGLAMAINLSVRNLLDRNCSHKLEEIMRRVGVDPGHVEFELTETAVMSDPEAAVTMLGRITATGARLAIDDFGTGYSSLAYLRRFPVHAIKIDRSFVTDMAAGERSPAIVRSTLYLAHSLGLQAVAEGVGDQETAVALHAMGCELAQGFFFARPAPADEIGPYLRTSRWTLPGGGHAST